MNFLWTPGVKGFFKGVILIKNEITYSLLVSALFTVELIEKKVHKKITFSHACVIIQQG